MGLGVSATVGVGTAFTKGFGFDVAEGLGAVVGAGKGTGVGKCFSRVLKEVIGTVDGVGLGFVTCGVNGVGG